MQSKANKRKTGKEQYYTNSSVADLCVAEVQNHVDLTGKTILEPAGGTGEFIEAIHRHIPDANVISYDIDPKHPEVLFGDFLGVMDLPDNLVTITNPPFGRANSLSVQFFNKAALHSDYVCFLIPKSWRKWSVINKLDDNFHLVADVEMPMDCFYTPGEEDNKKGVLKTVFQIWERRPYKREKLQAKDNGLIKKVNPKNGIVSGANFSMVVFGHSCGRCEHVNGDTPSKTTTMYFDIDREDVKDAMKKIDFSCFYNNVAYVQALSIQEINFKLNEYFDLPQK